MKTIWNSVLAAVVLSFSFLSLQSSHSNQYLSDSYATEYFLEQDSIVRGISFASFQKLTSNLDTIPNAMNKAWRLWKAEKWDKLEAYFEKENLNGEYPPADGFISIDTVVLADDTKIDRYGSLWGTFVAPTGTPFGQRALPASSKARVYYQFEVTKDIPGVLKGKAIPWFNEPGEGIQYMMPKSMKDLIKEGYIIILDSIIPNTLVDKYGE
ncbi:TNT domain-containing protein [Roseivirga sp.]|uniref:TNT domain-containing protein n=1 Tax=Roseivirga sp. TaxID=1964215 RepID=UPI003B529C1C